MQIFPYYLASYILYLFIIRTKERKKKKRKGKEKIRWNATPESGAISRNGSLLAHAAAIFNNPWTPYCWLSFSFCHKWEATARLNGLSGVPPPSADGSCCIILRSPPVTRTGSLWILKRAAFCPPTRRRSENNRVLSVEISFHLLFQRCDQFRKELVNSERIANLLRNFHPLSWKNPRIR